MDSLITELSNININNLKHLSLDEVPSHIGGSKPTKTVAPCQLHSELLSKVQPIPPVSSVPFAPASPIACRAEKQRNTTSDITSFSFELSDLSKRYRVLTVKELDEWLLATRPCKWTNILDKIRKGCFQLEPIMYEDFIIL